MNQLEDAIATLRLRQHVNQATAQADSEALTLLMRESLRMQVALRFYASQDNYLDSVPMLKDDQGLLTLPDEGSVASQVLRTLDFPLGIVLRGPEEGNSGLPSSEQPAQATTH